MINNIRRYLREQKRRKKMQREMRRLKSLPPISRTPEAVAEFAVRQAQEGRPFGAAQKQAELCELLRHVSGDGPKILCEIGALSGGTLWAFSQIAPLGSVIISVDIAFSKFQMEAYPLLAPPGVKVQCFCGDSKDPAIVEAVKKLAGADGLDLLLIDGDHTYQGVRSDFELYDPLVREGGLTAIHDIVSDFKTRFGRPSGTDTGEVPRYWRELKMRFPQAKEFIEDAGQDGYGIGILRKGACETSPVRSA